MLKHGMVLKLILSVFLSVFPCFLQKAFCMKSKEGEVEAPIAGSFSKMSINGSLEMVSVTAHPLSIPVKAGAGEMDGGESGYESTSPGNSGVEKSLLFRRGRPTTLSLPTATPIENVELLSPGSDEVSKLIEKIKSGEECKLGRRDTDGVYRYVLSLDKTVAVKIADLSGLNRDVFCFALAGEPVCQESLTHELSEKELSEYFNHGVTSLPAKKIKKVVLKLSNTATYDLAARYGHDARTFIGIGTYQQARRDVAVTLWLDDYLKGRNMKRVYVPKTRVAIVSGRELLAQIKECSYHQFEKLRKEDCELSVVRESNRASFNNGALLSKIEECFADDSCDDVPVFVLLQEYMELRKPTEKELTGLECEIALLKKIIMDFNESNNLLIDGRDRIVLFDVEDKVVRPFEEDMQDFREKGREARGNCIEVFEDMDDLLFENFPGAHYRAFADLHKIRFDGGDKKPQGKFIGFFKKLMTSLF